MFVTANLLYLTKLKKHSWKIKIAVGGTVPKTNSISKRFQANIPFLYPLKTSEKWRSSDPFRGV